MDRVWADYWDDDEWRPVRYGTERPRREGLLPARAKPVQDTPTPSPNGVAGIVVRPAARAHRGRALARAAARSWSRRSRAAPRELGLHARRLSAGARLAAQSGHSPGGRGRAPAIRRPSAMHRAALAGFAPRRVVRRLAPAERGEPPLPPPLAGDGEVGPEAARLRLPRQSLQPAG